MTSSLVLIALALIPVNSAASMDTVPQAVIEEAHARLAPAICLVTYSAEVTNPKSGTTSSRDSSALGLIVSSDGLVMTPGHMKLEDAKPFNIRVIVGSGESEQKFDATLLEKPDDVNICMLRIDAESSVNLPCVSFTQRALKLGEPLMLIGILSESLDFARGINICRVGAILEEPRTTYCLDQSIRYGFVGGPVIAADGAVVGVIGFDMTPGEGGDLYVRHGHPLVYQSALFTKHIKNPPTGTEDEAHESDGWLGVFTQPLTDDLAEYWNLEKNGGVVVSTLVPDSPAEAIGLRPGDVIVRFNEVPIRIKQDQEVLQFTKMVRESGAGNEVPIRVLRDGEVQDLTVSLGIRPKSAKDAGEFEDPVFGLTVREITTDVRIVLNISEDIEGVIVRQVRSGSEAALGGIRPGMIIMDFGGHPVANLDDFEQAVNQMAEEKPEEISVFCRFGTATGFCRLKPRWE